MIETTQPNFNWYREKLFPSGLKYVHLSPVKMQRMIYTCHTNRFKIISKCDKTSAYIPIAALKVSYSKIDIFIILLLLYMSNSLQFKVWRHLRSSMYHYCLAILSLLGLTNCIIYICWSNYLLFMLCILRVGPL